MIDWITNNWDELVGIVFAVLTVATLIVRVTPTEKDDKIIAKIKKALEAILKGGQNVGK